VKNVKATDEFSRALKKSLLKKWWIYIIFFVMFIFVTRNWLTLTPLWKSIPFLSTLLISFLFLMMTKMRSWSIIYCDISMALFIIASIIALAYTSLTSSPARESDAFNIVSFIALNLQFSIFIVLAKDIILARSIDFVVNEKWYQLIFFVALLFVYVSWFFAMIYSNPNMDGIRSTVGENFNKVRGTESWYFSITTLATLGTGEFIPVGNCRPVAEVEVITGFILLSVMVGLVAGAAYDAIKRRRLPESKLKREQEKHFYRPDRAANLELP